jgi:hypothetical protein
MLLSHFQFSAIFLTNVCMDIFGLKWSLILAGISYVLYIVANMSPLPSLMYTSKSCIENNIIVCLFL